MNKIVIFLLMFNFFLYGLEIPTEYAKVRKFGKSIKINSQIIQLSNAQQSVMSLVSGHIEKYFTQAGSTVKKGAKIALIKSITLSKMTADYISLKKQFYAQDKNYQASKKLHDKGMISMQELNLQSIQRDTILAQLNTLKSQLRTLGINADKLKKASSDYILYAHSDGRVSELLKPLHSVINENTPIISIVKNRAFYLKAFIPLKYAGKVKKGQKVVINFNNKNTVAYIEQILPEVDKKTQRIVALCSIDNPANNLFINAYVASTLYLDADKEYVAIKKSALSFFNNEWVVFIPKRDEHDDHSEYAKEDSHSDHDDHENHDDHIEKDDYDKHDDHKDDDHDDHKKSTKHGYHGKEKDSHDEHKEDEKPYEIRIVKIITTDGEFVAVEGIKEGEEYVSDKSYYVKSMILKSSLGGHGH